MGLRRLDDFWFHILLDKEIGFYIDYEGFSDISYADEDYINSQTRIVLLC